MAGLLGDSWDDPRTMAALQMASGLLASGGPSRQPQNLGVGLLGGLQQYQGVMDNARRQKMLEQQMQIQQDDFGLRKQEFGLREQDRQLAISEKQRQAQIAQQRDQYLAGLAAGNPLNPAEAFRFGITPEHAKSLVESGNWGRPVVKTWKQVRGPNGVIEIGLDDYGQPVQGAQQTPYIAPRLQDLGGSVVAVDETALRPGQTFGKTVSPDTQYSGGITMRGQNMTDARGREANALKREEITAGGKPPAGYRWTANGTLEPIPGGPAAGMNDAQSKANLFGTRAQEADKIIGELARQGVNRPGNIKTALESTPLIGGGLGALTNWTQSGGQQKVEQAQRDFVNAVLRRESGAVISPDEFDNARKQYFPQLGDSPDVIAQKARNRQIATQGIIAEVPEGRRGVPAAGMKPPPAAISELKLRKADPAARQQFDAVFGPGAADAVLGGQ